jgi:3-deoxy-manno-octulosonate cytidylyltransferase (CMP-KDO synthetase)
MPVLAAIPARLGATRLPRKPLRLLGGLPLIVRVARHVAALDVADRCVVATDSEEILETCRAWDVHAALTREDHPSGTDRVAELAARPEHRDYDVILNVQGDEPFVSAEAIAGAVEMVKSGRFALGTAAAIAPSDVLARPEVVKVVCTDDGRALYFSRAPIPYLREPSDAGLRDGLVRQHIGVYAYTRDALDAWVGWPAHPLELIERLEQLRPLAHGVAMGVAFVAATGAFGIDTEHDLERAERLLLSRSSSSSDAPAASATLPNSNRS